MQDDFPKDCSKLTNPEKNCLRIDLVENMCNGNPRTDLPIAFRTINSREVGKALTECTASMPLTQAHVFKHVSIPGCIADDEIDGSSSCIKYV